MNAETIEHNGEIIAMGEGVAKVRIIQTSACAECHAKGVCTASDQSEKIVEAEVVSENLKVGDTVKVVGQKNLGIYAVLLAYVVPFLLIIVVMVVLNQLVDNELIVGTASLGVLVPYLIVLRLMRNRLKATFRFYVVEK